MFEMLPYQYQEASTVFLMTAEERSTCPLTVELRGLLVAVPIMSSSPLPHFVTFNQGTHLNVFLCLHFPIQRTQ